MVPIVTEWESAFHYVHNFGPLFLFLSNQNAKVRSSTLVCEMCVKCVRDV